MIPNPNIRNIAIIAHVDHGKTTLLDLMFQQSGLFREGAELTDRVMDSGDLERERGITISAKNCSIVWHGVKINILDTPGHADFGGEVERALMMVDGAILLVDAAEGPLPQTRFVLSKTLAANKKVIVCINKIDRHDARPQEVLNEIYDLFIDLGATEEQIEFPCFYTIGRDGMAKRSMEDDGENLHMIFDSIVEEINPPMHDPDLPFQMLVTNLSYSGYLGQLAIGRSYHGTVKSKDPLIKIGNSNARVPLKVTSLQTYQGLSLQEAGEATPGDIVILSGVGHVEIGDTICHASTVEPLPRVVVEEPTVSMMFTINTSPFAGQDGTYVQAKRIYERLQKETLHNVSLKVEGNPNSDAFIVKGRGEFQLAILIETMRREGYELSVGRPKIIFKEKDGKTLEPIEHLFVDCGQDYSGVVTEKLLSRKGILNKLVSHDSGTVSLEFSIPSRSLIGYRDQFLTDTKGTGMMNSFLEGYEPYRGDIASRTTGSLVADRQGKGVAYALFNLEPRGRLFITPNIPFYEGMVVGEHNRNTDLDVNPAKAKKLTNVRASGKDDAVQLTPITPMSLEDAIGFITDDELIEVTPKNIRIRKKFLTKSTRPKKS